MSWLKRRMVVIASIAEVCGFGEVKSGSLLLSRSNSFLRPAYL
jgi:hypothetical protein